MEVGVGGDPGRLPSMHRGAMVGRERELARVLELVGGGEHRLITVSGRGGVGKTRLAQEVAGTVAATGDRDVVTVPLASVVDPNAVLDEIADLLGVRSTERTPLDALVRRLHRTDTLLVLDNVEHLVASGPSVNELIERCPRITVLVTSQTRLGLVDERVMLLAPLAAPLADVADPELLAGSPAVALYVSRAEAVAGGTDRDLGAVAELCCRLEGLPLAIELAAARARTLSAAEVLHLLDEAPLDTLRGGARDVPARHHDLRTAIAWTGALLADDEQALLRHLSVVPGSFELDVAAAVHGCRRAADVVNALSTLVDFHLVDPIGDGWFTMPSSIRAYAGDLLDAVECDETVIRFVTWCTRSETRLDGRTEVLLRGGLRLAIEAGRGHEALRLVDRLGPIWERTRRRREHDELIEAALGMPSSSDMLPTVRARALLWSAVLAPSTVTSADRDRVARRIAEAEEVARVEGDDGLLLRALAARLLATAALGPVPDVAAFVEGARAVADRTGDQRWVARCDVWAGLDAQRRGDVPAAIEHGRAALRTARELRDDRILAHATMLLAPARELVSELGAEVPTLDEVLGVVRRAGLVDLEGLLLPMLVDDAVDAGNLEPAVRWCTEGLELAADAPATVVAVTNLLVAVYVAEALGDDSFAARLYGSIQGSVTGLLPALQPHRAARFEDAVARLHTSLGVQFDELARAGAALSWAEALEEALAVVGRQRRLAVRQEGPATSGLTPRERDVLHLLAAGMTNKEIGRRLALSVKTVMHHTGAIYRKLGVRGRSEAAVWCVNNDLASR